MSRFKNGLMKRVMAVVLSCTMIMSNMTAFASETPADTRGYVEETVDDVSEDNDKDEKSADNKEAENNADENATTEDAVVEETTKSEDNASSDKKDDGKDAEESAKETVAEDVADGDDKADAVEDDKASETESSLSVETEDAEPEEKNEESEDVKDNVLQPLPIGETKELTFTTELTGKANGEEVLMGNDFFSIVCASNTRTETSKTARFYFYDASSKDVKEDSVTGRIVLGGSIEKDKKSIKFVTQEAVDVTVCWNKSTDYESMSILDNSGQQIAVTSEYGDGLKGKNYVSIMTLKNPGTYYLGGNNYLYKVIVSPHEEEKKDGVWDFSSDATLLEMKNAYQKTCTMNYFGLTVDGNYGGKFQKRSNGDIWMTENMVLRVPVNGRSELTIVTSSGPQYGCYTVDDVAASTEITTNKFISKGTDGYANIRATASSGGTYIKSITVKKINERVVSGTVSLGTGVAIPEGLEVTFTDTKDKNSVISDTVGSNGTYSVTLYEGSTYDISLSGNYVISEPADKQITVGSTAITDFKITAGSMDANEVSGSVTFETGTAPDNFVLKFMATDETHSATAGLESSNTGNTYKVSLDKTKAYTISLAGTGMKDYKAVPSEIPAGATSQAITIKEREKHNVSLEAKSFDNKVDFSDINITFTDIGKNDDDTDTKEYKYSCAADDSSIALRDGTYSISLNKEVGYPYQVVYSELEVNGEGTYQYALDFKERFVWDFTIADPVLVGGTIGQGGLNKDGTEKYEDDQYYNGLYINTGLVKDSEGNYLDASGNIVESKDAFGGKFDVRVGEKRVQVNNSTKVKIPVSGRGTVAISPANGSFMLKKLTDKDQDASTAANQNENGKIKYNEGTRYVLMEATGLVWLTKIEVTPDPAVEVKGSILNPENLDLSGCTMSFVNRTDGAVIPVEIKDDNSYTVKLTSGHTYAATLSGNAQYGFAETNKIIQVEGTDPLTGKDLTVVSKDTIKYTGKITGFAQDYKRLDNLKVILTAGVEKTELTIDKTDKTNITFEAVLESGTEYTIQLEGVDDYGLTSDATIQKDTDYTANITVEAKPTYAVSGKFLESDDAEIKKVSFTYVNEGVLDKDYVYDAELNAAKDGYSVKLRDGEYEASAEVNGYATKTHVIVNGGKVEKDLLFIWTDTSALTYKADLYVGYADKADNYKTVTKALKAAKRMSPSADKRITIHIAPGTYREQIIVDVPYITFKNDTPSEKVKLTWYYGIGYKYYSIKPSLGEDGFYDAEYAYNKTEKHTAFRWGCTVQVKATDFRAENIVFENSFNRYLTKEEIADGVEPVEQEDPKNNKPVRDDKLDLRSKAAGERAAALYIEDQGDKAEFYNCQFLSNQDTIGTGSTTPRSYFKNCLIEGNTDYICGAGDAVFDNCELKFAGYSDASSGGYITAASTPRKYGYLFWNCTVTGTTNDDPNKDIGYLGRPWNKKEDTKLATVTFVNTVLDRADIIYSVGWKEMGDFNPSDVNYKEYNTTVKGGGAADTSQRTAGTVVSENPVPDMTVYFDGWTPAYYNHVDAPTSETEPGTVAKGTEIVLKCATDGAKIYYTKNGDAPTADSTPYVEGTPIVLDTEGEIVIKAIAIKGSAKSTVVEFTYTVVDAEKFVAAPTAKTDHEAEQGKVPKGTKVTLECVTEDAAIYYTTDGSDPKEGTSYTAPFTIDETTTIKAIAKKGENWSDPLTVTYTVETDVEPVIVAPPTAAPAGGTSFKVGDTATVTLEHADAEIYYIMSSAAISGDPGAAGTPYNGPITLDTTKSGDIYIKAVAIKDGKSSEALELHYIVLAEGEVAPPTADPVSGSTVKVGDTITLAAPGSNIYFRVNGDPLEKDDPYITPIVIEQTMVNNGTVTINAYAELEGKKSRVVSFTYTVEGGNKPVNPPITPSDPDDPGIDKSDIWITGISKTPYDYTGGKIIPDVKVWDCDIEGNDRLLVQGIDYTIAYKNNVKPGTDTAQVIVTGKGNYVGKDVTEKFSIKEVEKVSDANAKDVKGAKIIITDPVPVDYDGKAHYPNFTINFKDKTKADYKYNEKTGTYEKVDGEMDVNVAVSGNVNKGSATILVTGQKVKGKATSTKASFKINPVDLGKVTLTVEAADTAYAVKGAAPASLKIKWGDITLVNGRDYVAKYANNKTTGKATVTITGKGNYAKKYTKTVTYEIGKLDMSGLSVSAAVVYDKIKVSKVKVTVLDKERNELKPAQYTLKVYKADKTTEYGKNDELKEGDTVYVEATAKDTVNLEKSTEKIPFTVGKDISKAKFKLKKTVKKSYTGDEVKLSAEDFEPVTIKGKGTTDTLTMGVDFEIVAYSNNVNKGTATAVIKGINGYSGTKTIKFKIGQKTMKKGN